MDMWVKSLLMPKSDRYGPPVLVQQYVGRFYVAVNYVVRMCAGQGFSELAHSAIRLKFGRAGNCL